jgi:hypothetical protein
LERLQMPNLRQGSSRKSTRARLGRLQV